MPDLTRPLPAVQTETNLTMWRRLAPLGLSAVGFGLSLVGEATLRKGRGEPFVLYGTAALCVVNTGLCLFGEAVKHRALADWALQEDLAEPLADALGGSEPLL